MRIEDNCGGGDTVILDPGDSLDDVPSSHRKLLTAALRRAFADPIAHFRDIAERCPFPRMVQWLEKLLKEGKWALHLNKCNPEYGDWSLTGFQWSSKQVRGATIALPRKKPRGLPKSLQDYYSLVDEVNWIAFGGAGDLDGSGPHKSLAKIPYYRAVEDADAIHLWGSSACGDMLIYSTKDRGGWLSHETSHIHWLGSIADAINWVYGELLANRTPDYDYNQWH
jgi:hypothetical protein